MTFPLWYVLIPYALVLLGTGLFMFFNLYHVAKFGIQSFSTTALLLLYFVGYLVVIAFSVSMLSSFDWSATIALSDVIPFTGDNGSNTNFGL